MSFAQERLWFIEQYEEGTNAYNVPAMFELSEDVDKNGIKYALQQVVSRHEILRSTIEQGYEQENTVQKVHTEPLLFEEVSLASTSDYESLIKKDINQPFDLTKEYPIRVKFYHIEPSSENSLTKTLLLINKHHIATDGWSDMIFQEELSAYYEAYIKSDTAFSLPDLEIQYKDYALWQRSYTTGNVLDKQLSYWKDKLSGFQSLKLSTDYSRPPEIGYRGAIEEVLIDEKISSNLRKLAVNNGVTLHTVMLSSVSVLLSKYTGQDDIVTGSFNANRHDQQTEGLIGFFVNTQANRIILNNTQSFEELIKQVHRDQIESQLNQDLPFEKLINELDVERDPSKHPIFQVMFGLQNFESTEKHDQPQENYFDVYQMAGFYEVEKFDLSIFIDDSQNELNVQFSYSTSCSNKCK